jgi:hypothetical protein
LFSSIFAAIRENAKPIFAKMRKRMFFPICFKFTAPLGTDLKFVHRDADPEVYALLALCPPTCQLRSKVALKNFLKVHNRENFFGSDFEIFIFL